MMAGLRGWLLALVAASLICALADALMPKGTFIERTSCPYGNYKVYFYGVQPDIIDSLIRSF